MILVHKAMGNNELAEEAFSKIKDLIPKNKRYNRTYIINNGLRMKENDTSGDVYYYDKMVQLLSGL